MKFSPSAGADKSQLFDAGADATGEDPAEESDGADKEEQGHPPGVGGAVEDVLVGVEVVPHLVYIAQPEVVAGQAEEAEAQHPGADVGVVDEHDQRTDDTQNTEILGPFLLAVGKDVEHPRHRAMAVRPAVAPHAPLDPHHGDAQQQE
jgi:hypothetical protein